MPQSFLQRLSAAPAPYDAEAGAHALDALRAVGRFPARAGPLLAGALGSAPYLARLARRFGDALPDMLAQSPEQALERELDALRAAAQAESPEALDAALRTAKARIHLLTALADLGGVWELEDVTKAMTEAADAALQSAAAAHARFLGAPEAASSGYFIIALGKQGARELNYSSDIDIAAFYSPAAIPHQDPGAFCTRLTRRIVSSLSQQTADGYVFRVDLRLRPDPLSTPVALPVEAAIRYYESSAQTWERAAWIKARVVAGDAEAGARFLQSLQPFVWRRSMDYAAISDMASIMRQIADGGAAESGGAAGLDVKRCAGGIRHIEFFAQMQQLLWGGRDDTLRLPATLAALEALAQAERADTEDCAILAGVYRRLRAVEHRIQMLEDQPTQEIPADDPGRARLALLSGASGSRAFESGLLAEIGQSRGICSRLFADVPVDDAQLGFDGPEPPPAVLRRLGELGFADAPAAWEVFSGWTAGQPRAMRSERARGLARRLAPRIAAELGATSAPDAALVRFDEFVRALPAGVQLLSMLEREPRLLADLIDTLTLSPRLARELSQHPEALEAFLAFDAAALAPAALEQRIGGEIGGASGLEEALDRARRLTRETMFLIALAVLRGEETAGHASEFYAGLAGALIRALLPRAEADLRRRYGAIDGEFVVIGFGSFGASEMTVRSDTDIVMVYDAPEGAQSAGERPLHAETYFGRLAQRFVSALSAPTAEGLLFHIDLKLRPFGDSGPVASRLSAYEHYYRTEAWTWEKMALTRARVAAGSAALGRRVTALIRDVLTQQRDPAATATDVADMRARLEREKPAAGFWDLAQPPGALTDVRFTAQYLQLVTAARAPEVLQPSTLDAIAALRGAGALSQAEADALSEAARLHLDLAQLFALAAEGPFDPENVSQRLRGRLARAGGVESFAELEKRVASARQAARNVFEDKVLGARDGNGGPAR